MITIIHYQDHCWYASSLLSTNTHEEWSIDSVNAYEIFLSLKRIKAFYVFLAIIGFVAFFCSVRRWIYSCHFPSRLSKILPKPSYIFTRFQMVINLHGNTKNTMSKWVYSFLIAEFIIMISATLCDSSNICINQNVNTALYHYMVDHKDLLIFLNQYFYQTSNITEYWMHCTSNRFTPNEFRQLSHK